MKRVPALFLLALSLFITSESKAFDGQRKGFMFGFGLGAGWVHAEEPRYWGGNYGVDLNGFITHLKIGGAANERLALHYSGVQTFNIGENGFTLAFPSIGATYFLRDKAPSPMIMTAIGVSLGFGDGYYPLGTGDITAVGSGVGILFGVGYEFQQHMTIEVTASISSGALNDFFSLEPDQKTRMITVAINYLGY